MIKKYLKGIQHGKNYKNANPNYFKISFYPKIRKMMKNAGENVGRRER